MPTMASNPARKYEMITEGPVREKANPGNIKIPELIIAPVAIQNTSRKVNPFFNSIIGTYGFFRNCYLYWDYQ
ncbi:MAG: hypothetical protein BBJ60_10420 [Desulfobacterales bacterium S7086C20]|nr:MAG: hypothetical protein BBJ60_10420 [Desulfobacterales bacterium S7086C20]